MSIYDPLIRGADAVGSENASAFSGNIAMWAEDDPTAQLGILPSLDVLNDLTQHQETPPVTVRLVLSVNGKSRASERPVCALVVY